MARSATSRSAVRRRHHLGWPSRASRPAAARPASAPRPRDPRADGQLPRPRARPARRPRRTTSSMTTGSAHEADINRLAEAGITSGCATTACTVPASPSRATRWPASSPARSASPARRNDYFTDDDGTAHEARHQPPRRGRHHGRLHGHPLLPERDRQPRADGGLPPPRARRRRVPSAPIRTIPHRTTPP